MMSSWTTGRHLSSHPAKFIVCELPIENAANSGNSFTLLVLYKTSNPPNIPYSWETCFVVSHSPPSRLTLLHPNLIHFILFGKINASIHPDRLPKPKSGTS